MVVGAEKMGRINVINPRYGMHSPEHVLATQPTNSRIDWEVVSKGLIGGDEAAENLVITIATQMFQEQLGVSPGMLEIDTIPTEIRPKRRGIVSVIGHEHFITGVVKGENGDQAVVVTWSQLRAWAASDPIGLENGQKVPE